MVKRIKRITVLTLCMAMIVSSGSCNQGGGRGAEQSADTTTNAAFTTEDPNKEIDIQIDYDEMADIGEVDAVNEEGAGKLWESGKTAGHIKVLSWFDFHNIAPEKDIAELYAERFGGTVETEVVSSLEVINRLGVLMAAGQSPDIMRMQDEFFPSFFLDNRFTPMDDWIDIDSPLWSDMKDVSEKFAYNGQHYYYPYAVTATEYGITYCSAELEEIGAPDPMELYFEGNWTWNEFEEICLQWKASNSDKYPIAWPGTLGVQLAATTGTPVIEFTGTEIKNNLKDPNVVRSMEFIEKLVREECFWEGWHGPDALESWLGTLFFIMPLDWAYPCGQEIWFKNQFEGEIRTVPMPRDPNSDKYYMYGKTSGYVVPSGTSNPQGAAAFLLASRIWATDPDVVDAQREELLYDGGYFYIKCAECKYKFENERDEIDAVCPECNAPRKAKYKTTYTDKQMQIYDDLLDPSKFTFVFDCHRGFGDDMSQYMIDVFDTPISSLGENGYTYQLDSYYNTFESVFDEYRADMKENSGS